MNKKGALGVRVVVSRKSRFPTFIRQVEKGVALSLYCDWDGYSGEGSGGCQFVVSVGR